MSMPDLRKFIGWNKPAIELVAEKLEELNRSNPNAFRRATVVVPTSGSGRRLREYMAERAGSPLLMPKITLAGQLIPVKGTNIATEHETLAAWMHVLGQAMVGKPLPWLMDVATQMQRVRKQLEQELRSPDLHHDNLQSFVKDYLHEPEAQWENTIRYEKERWDTLQTTFSRVDEQLAQWGLTPAEHARAQELESPTPRGLLIIACVPELSPINQLYLHRLVQTGAAHVEIWVNAPENEMIRFDACGQPIPIISGKNHEKLGWSECPIDIPPPCNGAEFITVTDIIHPTGSVPAFGQKVRELAGGHDAAELVLASCDNSLSQVLVSAFRPDWQINLPEGRSLMATEAGRIPIQLRDAYLALHNEDQTSNRCMEDLLALLRNRTLQCSLGSGRVPATYNRYLTELYNEYLPGSIQRVLTLMRRQLSEAESSLLPNEILIRRLRDYISYTENVLLLLEDCNSSMLLPARLRELASALSRNLSSPEMKRAARLLSNLLRDTASLVARSAIDCPPQTALMIMAHMAEKNAPGTLEGAGNRNKAINLKGWRELCYTHEPVLIIAGMHDGHVPERLPADAYLPNAYRTFMNMTNDTTRCARDSFLLTALLHSRPAGSIHFVLSSCTTDGAPIAPSSLLLRCRTTQETAQRVNWLFSEQQVTPSENAYDLLPFITAPAGIAEKNESISLIAPGINNPYASKDRTFSPSAIKSFLTCPLRFWLNKLLHVSPGDALQEDKSEPDFAEYGTLLHAILQDITTRYSSVPEETDSNALASEIAAYAEECCRKYVAEQYGDESMALPVPLRILQKSLSKTTQAFAKYHAEDLCNGWEVLQVEEQLCFSIPSPDGAPLLFDVRVDRIDRHKKDGRMRIIDYKSNDSDPRKTHWEKLSDTSAALYDEYMPPEFVIQDSKGNSYRWNSVQLPLYAEALRIIHHLEEIPETAFYNLPRNTPGVIRYTTMCGVEAKSPMTKDLHEKAMQCIQAAAHLMRNGLCLFSAESLGRSMKYDSFGALTIYKDPDPRVMCCLPVPELPTIQN